jgi:MYXO-CTERM domain-containing protein
MQRSTTISALVLAGVIASPALVNAQANPTANGDRDATGVADAAMTTDRNDDADYGWVGLLGLAGLLGLRRRERADTRDQVRTRQTV